MNIIRFLVLFASLHCAHAQVVSGTSGSLPGAPVNPSGPLPPFPVQNHAPTAIHHVGTAYNILKGNPDGEYWSTGGEDPGLVLTRRVLSVSPGDRIPEVTVEHHDGCQYSHGFTLFHSTKSYQDKLMTTLQTSGNTADKALLPFAFTLSSGYQAVAQQTSHHHYVYQDATTLCTLGHVRYKSSLASSDHFPVSREFAQAVCSLPTMYSSAQYMKFIDDWGTHVLTEATIGKSSTNRFVGHLRDLFNFVMVNVSDELSLGGPIFGYPDSYVINMDSFKYRHEYKYIIGPLEDSLTIGDLYNSDVIGKTLDTIDMALDVKYWFFLPHYVQEGLCPPTAGSMLAQWKTNILQALGDYPAYKQAAAPEDQPLAMPITWPLGTYSLPKPKAGCPASGFMEGTVNMPQTTLGNPVPSGLSMDGTFTASAYALKYCTKEDPVPSMFDIYWPRGDYCILEYDNRCPLGFKLGYMKLKPEPTTTTTGVVPTGTYQDHQVVMNFCCRNDTVYSHPMILPKSAPFYLLRNRHGCQHVQGMTSTEEVVTFYNNIQDGGGHAQTGLSYSYPYVEAIGDVYGAKQYKLHYCYYTPN